MTLTPAIKGRLTKLTNDINRGTLPMSTPQYTQTAYQRVFERHMPREQAKHAAKKYLASGAK